MQNKKDFAEQDANRKLEILAQEERAQERLREIEDQLARDLEELRRCDQQRRQEMNEQMENIRRLLQMKIWNDVIESNWTKRLNSLRSSNKDVERAYNQIRRSSKNYHETHAKHLLLAVVNQKSIMDNEKYEMEKLHAEHEKPFLLEIKGAVEEVSAECDRLSYVLQVYFIYFQLGIKYLFYRMNRATQKELKTAIQFFCKQPMRFQQWQN